MNRMRVVQKHVLITVIVSILLIGIVVSVLKASPALFLLFVFVGLTFINYRLGGRDVLYPAFIFCATWSAAVAVYLLCPVEIDQLVWKTVSIFACGAICFTAGSRLGNRKLIAGVTWLRRPPSSLQGVRLLLLYSLATLPFFVVDTARIAGQPSLSQEFLMAARSALLNAEGTPYSSHFIALAPLVAVLTTWLLILERDRYILVLIAGVSASFMCFLGGGRGSLLQLLCGCFVLYMVRNSDRTLRKVGKKLVLFGVSSVVLMTMLSLYIKQETQAQNGVRIAANMSALYISGPLAGFNYQVNHPEIFEKQPWNTFTQVLTPLVNGRVINVKLAPTNEEFVNVPLPVNVFTIYKPYYHDVGILGCMLVMIALGFGYGSLFNAAVRGNKLACFALAVLMEGIVMSVFHDEFNYQLTIYVYIAAYTCLYFLLIRKIPSLKLFPRTAQKSILLRHP